MNVVRDIQFPIQVTTNVHYVNLHEDTKDLNPRLEKFIRNTGDQMKKTTNVKAEMTYFNTVCDELEELHKIINPYLAKFYVANKRVKDTLKIEPNIQKIDTTNESLCTHADLTKSKRVLGYNPNTTFAEGIKEFLNWHKTYENI